MDRPGLSDFSQERNRLLAKVNTDWALFLDKDETLSGPLPENLDKRFNYAFKREDWFLGKKLCHGETASLRFTRLIQPGSGQWVGKVHEHFISNLQANLQGSTLKAKIIHNRKITISQFLDRINYYSDLKAQEINRFSLFELLFYPCFKFVKNYFWQLGCLDGIPGLAMAVMMSLHSLAVRIKVYEKSFAGTAAYPGSC